jgi:hypothetical protein
MVKKIDEDIYMNISLKIDSKIKKDYIFYREDKYTKKYKIKYIVETLH